MAAGIFDGQGQLFAAYQRDTNRSYALPAAAPELEGHQFANGHLHLYRRVLLKDAPIGTVLIASDMQQLHTRIGRYLGIVVGVLLISILIALWLSSRLQKIVSTPLLLLCATARRVAEQQDFTLRAERFGNDEIGAFTDAFNQMLVQIQSRDEALRESEERYRLLIENQGEGAALVNPDERFTLTNPAADELFGVSRGGLLGRSLREFLSDADYAGIRKETDLRRNGQRSSSELEVRRPDGSSRLLAINATPIFAHGEFVGTFGVFSDITERRRAERELRERLQVEQLVSETSTQFINCAPHEVGQGIDRALQAIGRFTGADRAYVFQLGEDATTVSNTNEWCAEEVQSHRANLQDLPVAAVSWWVRELSAAEVIHIPDTSKLPPEAEAGRLLIDAGRVRSLVLVPMAFAGKLTGCLGLDALRAAKTWSDADLAMLKLMAQIFVNALARQRAAEELERAHRQLLDSSRQAGMAEIATGVLHNVGNVLNSVNVSCTLVLDQVRQSKVANLPKVTAMLEAQNGRLAEFLTQDPKGKQIPAYLCSLAPVLIKERSLALEELQSLREKIDHIKEIVSMQQSYASVGGVIETLPLSQLVEDAIKLNSGALARHGVRVERQFEAVPPVAIDKHKVLQILLNLIRNAKYACDENGRETKRITVRVHRPQRDRIRVEVIDNGVGIPSENLTKIFAHGFTTRKDGHGFGLHSGALAAREMGGSLTAQSDGPGQGARFTLELPVQPDATGPT
jgi:PAS domain S-box-containing protein